jgi:hypothetical protein
MCHQHCFYLRLGQTSPNPVLTTLRHFRNEYEAHIIDKKCPSVVCQTCSCSLPAHLPGRSNVYVLLNYQERKIGQGLQSDYAETALPHVSRPRLSGPCQKKCKRGQSDEAVASAT